MSLLGIIAPEPVARMLGTDAGAHRWAPALDEAKKKNWTVISMKNVWKRVFAFDEKG